MVPSRRSPGSIAPSWLAWPTLREVGPGRPLPVTGDVASRLPSDDGTPQGVVMVELDCSGEAGPVTVLVGGEPVATIDAPDADAFRTVAGRLDRLGLPVTCRARIEQATDGVRLWLLGVAELGGTTSPFLPPFDRVDVLVDGEAPLPFEGGGERAVMAALTVRSDVTVVTVEGRPVGHLPGPARPYVSAALAAGFHATCLLEVSGGDGSAATLKALLPDGT